MRRRGMRWRVLAVVAVLGAVGVPAAHADGPGVGAPTIVTVGDSYISGEAGRWAGNTNNGQSLIDEGGADTYWDNASRTAETISKCHRSENAEGIIGGGMVTKNLACSGAK